MDVQHLKYLDGWRGLAITLVLAEHFGGMWGAAGSLGVDLFFVLSGYLMSRILFEQRVPLGVFYRRRVSRILPVFLLFLVVTISASWMAGLRVTSADLWASPLFLRSYADPFIWRSELPIGHLWSLNVEEHCYMLLALIAAVPFLCRRAGVVMVGLGLATFGAIALYLVFSDSPTQDWAIRTEVAAAPLLLSAGYRQLRQRWALRVPAWVPLLALVLGVACYAKGVPTIAKVAMAPFLLALAVNHIGETYAAVLRALEWKPLGLAGVWSYSLYLWQQPLYEFQDRLPAGVAFGLAVAVALLSYYTFERPARDWLNRNWRPRETIGQPRNVEHA